MTDYKDLIERLRENADLDAAEHVPHEVVQMQYEAADALEQLIVERDSYKDVAEAHQSCWAESIRLSEELAAVKAERDALYRLKDLHDKTYTPSEYSKEKCEILSKALKTMEAELAAIAAEREELVAALINQRDMWVDTRDSAKELQDNWMVDFAGQNIGQAEVVLAKVGADKTGEVG